MGERLDAGAAARPAGAVVGGVRRRPVERALVAAAESLAKDECAPPIPAGRPEHAYKKGSACSVGAWRRDRIAADLHDATAERPTFFKMSASIENTVASLFYALEARAIRYA